MNNSYENETAGAIAPADGSLPYTPPAAESAPTSLGPNNERLEDAKPHVVNALRDLVLQYRQGGTVARRHQIRRIRQARLFLQGVRYVADGQRFGFHDQQMLEAIEMPLGEDVYVCPQCGKEESATQTQERGATDAYASAVGAQHAAPLLGKTCPSCGTELTETSVR